MRRRKRASAHEAKCVHWIQVGVVIALLCASYVSAEPDPISEDCLVDIIFLLDVSESIDNITNLAQREFVKNISSQLFLNSTHGAVVTVLAFSRNVFGTGLRPFQSLEELQQNIDELTYEREGTHTDTAIARARDIFDQERREGVTKVIVLITDGQSKFPENTFRQAGLAKDEGITIIGVGVEKCPCAYNREEVDEVASPGYVYRFKSLEELSSLVTNITSLVCPSPPFTSTPSVPVITPTPTEDRGRTTTTETSTMVTASSPELTISATSVFSIPPLVRTIEVTSLSVPSVSIPSFSFSTTFEPTPQPTAPLTTLDITPTMLSAETITITILQTSTTIVRTIEATTQTPVIVPTTLPTFLQTETDLIPQTTPSGEDRQLTSTPGFSPTTPVLPPSITSTPVAPETTPTLPTATIPSSPMVDRPETTRIQPTTTTPPPTTTRQVTPPTTPEITTLPPTTTTPDTPPPTATPDTPPPTITPDTTTLPPTTPTPDTPPPTATPDTPPPTITPETTTLPPTTTTLPSTTVTPSTVRIPTRTPSTPAPETTTLPPTRTTRATPPPTTVSRATTTFKPPTTGGGDPCIDCLFVNGIGYNPHPDFCDYYYQCVPRGFVLVPFVRQCPPGEFWDHTRITCAPARTVICPVDPCRFNSSLESYPFPKSCRGYWQCLMGYSWRPACCPAGQTFIPGRGCSDSVFCEDRCPLDPPPAAEPSTLAPCVDKRAVPGDPTSYYQIITSRFEVLRPCSPNTGFSLQTCSCSVIIRPPQTIPDGVCRRFLYLPFNEDLRDHSVNMHSVRVEGPVVLNLDPAFGNVGGGSACFNGNSRLLIYSFAGRDFGKKFLLRFRYRESERNSSTNGVPEALVTNSDCFSPSSINVAFNRTQTTTVGDIRTALSSRELIIENTQTVWKEVEYRYNGTTFVLTVDGVVQSVSAAGNILIAKTALQIAHGCPLRGEMLGFVGYIDEVEVYLDCFPDDR